jgi:hypothetical protein
LVKLAEEFFWRRFERRFGQLEIAKSRADEKQGGRVVLPGDGAKSLKTLAVLLWMRAGVRRESWPGRRWAVAPYACRQEALEQPAGPVWGLFSCPEGRR